MGYTKPWKVFLPRLEGPAAIFNPAEVENKSVTTPTRGLYPNFHIRLSKSEKIYNDPALEHRFCIVYQLPYPCILSSVLRLSHFVVNSTQYLPQPRRVLRSSHTTSSKMPPSSSSRSSKPKPAEVAAETKKFLKKVAGTWPAYSYLFTQPLAITQDQFPPRSMMSLNPPTFCKYPASSSQGLFSGCAI